MGLYVLGDVLTGFVTVGLPNCSMGLVLELPDDLPVVERRCRAGGGTGP